MTSRERWECVFDGRIPDRVPIELYLNPQAAKDPRTARLRELIQEHVDPFTGWSPGWKWLGIDASYEEEEIERVPGRYFRMRRVYHTAVGDFEARTYHPIHELQDDYHWEEHYVSTPDDLRRLLDAPRPFVEPNVETFLERREQIGDSALLTCSAPHPFGQLCRVTLRDDWYAWLILERDLVHDLLTVMVDQVVAELERLVANGVGPYFTQSGMEMAIDPWMSRDMFEEYIVRHDSRIYDVIRGAGGKTRIHCHGNALEYLERLYEIGVDAIEPCEPPPQANVVMAEAKRRVGDRMILCGNIVSQLFHVTDPDETEQRVREVLRDGMPGGRFALRTTGGHAGTGNLNLLDKIVAHCERMVETAIEYGKY